MEFNEKLQELRKRRGLTQEELAEALYVSRTAVSKWESGRGYPSIDSLKAIAKYFSVTIDDLLSGDAVISIAEQENRMNLQNVCDLMLGITDLLSLLLIVLPLYPKTVDDLVYAVSLPDYTDAAPLFRLAYWVVFLLLIASGSVKIVLNRMKLEKGRHILTCLSLALSAFAVLFLSLTRQTYAVVIVFVLLMSKCVLVWKGSMR
ncbi:MAG: helix-turn-helix transcriptional regulator [Oscillospiraceae bacterium]|nr:helix-turn-helix transcriptional regulator [Oscillospiraceae bacterium]